MRCPYQRYVDIASFSSLLRRILILASAVFYYGTGSQGSLVPANLFDAHSLIRDSIGKGKSPSCFLVRTFDITWSTAAALLFALALLAAGQSASLVATVAAQSVSEGFLHWKVSVRYFFSDEFPLIEAP